MTGKLCVDEVVSGQSLEVCAATFEVVSVADVSATAKITGGEARAVTVGHLARFAQPLKPVESARAPVAKLAADLPLAPPKSPAAEELLARGNRLFDVKDWKGAAIAFGDFVAQFPGHVDVDYARKLLSACAERELATAGEVAEAKRKAADAAKAADLIARAERLLVAEKWAETKALAEEAIALDPSQERARSLMALAERQLSVPERTAPEVAVQLVISAEMRKAGMPNPDSHWKCAVFDGAGNNLCETDDLYLSGEDRVHASGTCPIAARRIDSHLLCVQFQPGYGQVAASRSFPLVLEGNRFPRVEVNVKFRTAKFMGSPVIESVAIE